MDYQGDEAMEGYTSQGVEPELAFTEERDLPVLPFSALIGDSIPILERMLESWAQLDGKPRLIVKSDGALVACSEEARHLLRAGGELKIERGIVMVTERAVRPAFERLLQVKPGDVETVLIPCGYHEGHWILRAVRADSDLVCLVLHRATEDYWANLPDLGSVFGLTPSEAGVVDDLYNGLSPNDIAGKRGISIHTVRAHLRRCYDKLHITSREQLWHRLRPYQI